MNMLNQLDPLADRIRDTLSSDENVVEKRMFGGIAFMINGHLLAAASQDGSMLLSVGKERTQNALSRPGTRQMIHGGRKLGGFIYVDGREIADPETLGDWLGFARTHVLSLPAK